MPDVLIRCESGREAGLGHIMRCTALAQSCRDLGMEVNFVQSLPSDLSAAEEAAFLTGGGEGRPRVVVLDSYKIDVPGLSQQLRHRGVRVVAIDDLGDRPLPVDLLINPNLGAEGLSYETAPRTVRLLGARYVLLRKPFQEKAKSPRRHPEVASEVLISLGGSDLKDCTRFVLEAMASIADRRLDGIQVSVVLGPEYRGEAGSMLRGWSRKGSRPRVERSPANMEELLASSDLAILAGGTTCYEAALLSLPFVLLMTAENQRLNELGLRRAGACLSLGKAEEATKERVAEAVRALALDHSLREAMGGKGRSLVDGEGASRVAQEIRQLL